MPNEHKFINTGNIYKSPVAWCLLYEGLRLSALKARDLMFSLLAFKMDFTFFTEKRNEHCGKGILLMTWWKNIWQLTAKSSQLQTKVPQSAEWTLKEFKNQVGHILYRNQLQVDKYAICGREILMFKSTQTWNMREKIFTEETWTILNASKTHITDV